MIKNVLFIARKDVQYMLRAKETIIWVFAMPILFFFFIGTITGGYGSHSTEKEKLAIQTGTHPGFLLDQLTHRLEEREFKIIRPESDSLFALYGRRLSVPDGFTDSVLAGKPVTLHFARRASGLGFDYDSIRINRAIYTVLADLIATGEMGDEPTPETFERLNNMPRALTLDVKYAGKRKVIPSGFEQAIPGIMVMFTLLILTTSGAILLVIERKQGLLRRLASTPIDRLDIVYGKWIGKLALGLVQIGFAMVAGTVLFKMDWGPNLVMVVVVLIAYGGLMASLGMLLGSLARTEGQASAIGVISANLLAALGGCWWPIEIAPAWMQKLQLFLPTGWAMDALHNLISFGSSPVTAVPHVVVLAVSACALLVLTAKVFRFQ